MLQTMSKAKIYTKKDKEIEKEKKMLKILPKEMQMFASWGDEYAVPKA